MTAEQLKKICTPSQYSALDKLYNGTPKPGGRVDCVDRTLERMGPMMELVDLDTVGAMMILLDQAMNEKIGESHALAVAIVIRLLKQNGFSFEDCMLLTARLFITPDSAATVRASSLLMAVSLQAADLADEAKPKINGASNHSRARHTSTSAE